MGGRTSKQVETREVNAGCCACFGKVVSLAGNPFSVHFNMVFLSWHCTKASWTLYNVQIRSQPALVAEFCALYSAIKRMKRDE